MTGYPLAAVVALRERQEALSRAALASALAEEDRRRTIRDAAAARASAQRGRLDAIRAAAAAPGARGAELRGRAAWLERLRRDARTLEAAVCDAERELRQARGESELRQTALVAAHAALRALERHRAAWRVETGRRRERGAEAAADDLVSARRAAP